MGMQTSGQKCLYYVVIVVGDVQCSVGILVQDLGANHNPF